MNFTKGLFRVKENYILTPASNSVAMVKKKKKKKAGVFAEEPMFGKLRWPLFISCSSRDALLLLIE